MISVMDNLGRILSLKHARTHALPLSTTTLYETVLLVSLSVLPERVLCLEFNEAQLPSPSSLL